MSESLLKLVHAIFVLAVRDCRVHKIQSQKMVLGHQNQNQSSTGIIGLLAQTQQALEVPQLELSNKITVFPNPTAATVYFETNTDLTHETVSVYTTTGQLVSEKKIGANNSLDLSALQNGVYLIQFSSKNINSFKIIKH